MFSMIKTFQQAKRIIKIVIGFTLLLVGLVITLLPGPAIIVIPVGLAILATEFVWARRILEKIRQGAKSPLNRTSRNIK